jgi:hypothetical protein
MFISLYVCIYVHIHIYSIYINRYTYIYLYIHIYTGYELRESWKIRLRTFDGSGICEALMLTMGTYIANSDWHNVNQLMSIYFMFIHHVEHIPRLIAAGLLEGLVEVFNSKIRDHPDDLSQALRSFQGIVRKLCAYDSNIRQQLNQLGIPLGAQFFGTP